MGWCTTKKRTRIRRRTTTGKSKTTIGRRGGPRQSLAKSFFREAPKPFYTKLHKNWSCCSYFDWKKVMFQLLFVVKNQKFNLNLSHLIIFEIFGMDVHSVDMCGKNWNLQNSGWNDRNFNAKFLKIDRLRQLYHNGSLFFGREFSTRQKLLKEYPINRTRFKKHFFWQSGYTIRVRGNPKSQNRNSARKQYFHFPMYE